MANLALGPEPAAAATLRALGQFVLGSVGAALIGLPSPHTPSPSPSPLLSDSLFAVALRLGRAVGAAVWGGTSLSPASPPRPPREAWESPLATYAAPRPSAIRHDLAPPLKSPGPGVWD